MLLFGEFIPKIFRQRKSLQALVDSGCDLRVKLAVSVTYKCVVMYFIYNPASCKSGGQRFCFEAIDLLPSLIFRIIIYL